VIFFQKKENEASLSLFCQTYYEENNNGNVQHTKIDSPSQNHAIYHNHPIK